MERYHALSIVAYAHTRGEGREKKNPAARSSGTRKKRDRNARSIFINVRSETRAGWSKEAEEEEQEEKEEDRKRIAAKRVQLRHQEEGDFSQRRVNANLAYACKRRPLRMYLDRGESNLGPQSRFIIPRDVGRSPTTTTRLASHASLIRRYLLSLIGGCFTEVCFARDQPIPVLRHRRLRDYGDVVSTC